MTNLDVKSKRPNKWVLPTIAGFMVIIALIVVLFIPNNSDKGSDNPTFSDEDKANVQFQTEQEATVISKEGELTIYADRLSAKEVSFIRISQDSRIELLARLGDDGKVKATLGTCQACNGSPKAYFTQEGDELICNNCGRTFPLSVLDSPGDGCHPIMLDEKLMKYDGNDLSIDLSGLSEYESLFSEVEDH